MSASRAISIHRFIESIATNWTCPHCSSTLSWSSGWMLARNSTSQSREDVDSRGWKSSNTLSWVSSVSRELRSQPYSPAQKNVLPSGTRSTSAMLVPRVASTVEVLVAEVGADAADDVNLVEERRREREVRGGAAEHPLALAERRLDRVERDRPDDRDAHARSTSAGAPASVPRPAASRSAAALSVRSHVKSSSSRPKWPYAAVFW